MEGLRGITRGTQGARRARGAYREDEWRVESWLHSRGARCISENAIEGLLSPSLSSPRREGDDGGLRTELRGQSSEDGERRTVWGKANHSPSVSRRKLAAELAMREAEG